MMKKSSPTFVLIALFASLPLVAKAQTAEQALAFEQRGNLAGAAELWLAVTQRNPQDADAFAHMGFILAKEQKYQDAESSYRKALALNPSLPGLELNLGLAEFKQGNFRAAVPAFKSALAADPSSAQARSLLGMSYYATKEYGLAIEYLDPVSRAEPGNLELQEILVESCLWLKNAACSKEHFDQIMKQDPNSAAAHILMGEAYDGLGESSNAIAEFEAAKNISPNEPRVHFGLGYLYWKSREYDEAKREFENELSADSSNALALTYLADIALKGDHPDAALSLLDRATKINKDIRFAYLDLGFIYLRKERYKDAQAAFHRAVTLDPSQSDAHYQLGRLYQLLGNTTAADQEFDVVQKLYQKSDEKVAKNMLLRMH
jgi:tetratricopeptide (TPR) repeat protein